MRRTKTAAPTLELDLTGWYSRDEAMREIGCSERTLQRLVEGGKIRAAKGAPEPGRVRPTLYHWEDVAQQATRANGITIASSATSAAPAAPVAAVAQLPQRLAALAELAAAFPAVRPSDKLLLTLDEAAEYSGAPKSYLMQHSPRLWVDVGMKRRTIRFPRKRLEELAR